jgi:hypothetical protein
MFKISGISTLGLLCALLQLVAVQGAFAQVESDEKALLNVRNGISISQDSLFLLNLRFRMQNRFGLQSLSGDDFGIGQVDARVRRLRLRLDGFVMDEKLQYYIQLSFSRADQDVDQTAVPQIVRDAVLYYTFNEHFYVGMGQAKLPGNRQRVVSSGNLQFADRSLLNNELTIDRDFGFFGYGNWMVGNSKFNVKAAFTTGEGRGGLPGNNGLAYTGRLEWLPFGVFRGGGDYSEGDLVREERPKLSVGIGASNNIGARRVGGQLGQELFAPRDFYTSMADAILKYRGWAVSQEYIQRNVANPLVYNVDSTAFQVVYKGAGHNTQLSYCFKSGHEFALRYTRMLPHADIQPFRKQTEELWLGWNKYFNGHRIKTQVLVRYRWLEGNMALGQTGNHWATMLQVEFGI